MSNEIKIYTTAELQKAENPALSAGQMNFLLKPTPAQFRRKRPGKGGGEWECRSDHPGSTARQSMQSQDRKGWPMARQDHGPDP
jgi:hypothetical protein